METVDEIQEPKPVLGVRIPAKTKQELCTEAEDLGLTLSELAESVLLNRHSAFEEIFSLKKQLEALQKQLTDSQSEADRTKLKYLEQIELYKQELEKQASLVSQSAPVLDLLNDARLLELFEAVKDKKDEIENAGGQNLIITYRAPKDLLTAMIYSFKLKK